MISDYQVIGFGQLALAAGLVVINMAISWGLRLGMLRSLLVASLRTVVQLLLIGFVLEWLFTQDHPWITLGLGLVMAGNAGIAGVNRTRRRFPGIYWNSLLAVLVAAGIVTGLTMGGIVRVEPWYSPQYLIPMLGMVLGNVLNGISLGLDRFMEGLIDHQGQIELLLSLGATRWEAAHQRVQDAVRVGMIPVVNSMMVVGLVSLPGMMTGQILAGASPLNAVRYQIMIMFMIAAGTALGVFGIVLLAFRLLLGPEHRLRLERLR